MKLRVKNRFRYIIITTVDNIHEINSGVDKFDKDVIIRLVSYGRFDHLDRFDFF